WFHCLLFLAASLVLYANSLHGPFVLDDIHSISKNPGIQISDLSPRSLVQAATAPFSPNRPVPKLSFGIQAFASGQDPYAFHLVNVLIHALTGMLLYLLLRLTWARAPALPEDRSAGFWVPLAATALWLVHPVQTQSVAYIVQRMTSLAALFYVASILCYARGRLSGTRGAKAGWFLGCAACGAAAVGSKEIAVTLPVFLFLYEWFFFQDLSGRWLVRKLPALGVLVAGAVAVLLVYTDFDPMGRILRSYENRDYSLIQRVFTEWRVVVWYVTFFLVPLPFRQTLDHDFSLSRSLFSPPATLLCGLAILGALVWAVWAARRQRLLAFAVFWFFGNLAMESTVFGLEILFEHRMYLPSMFLSLGVVVLAFRFLKSPRARAWVLGSVMAVFAVLTVARSAVWADGYSLWMDSVEKSPGKMRPVLNLGALYLEDNRPDLAVPWLEKALAMEPGQAWTLYNLGRARGMMGEKEEERSLYERALAADPDLAEAHNNLGLILIGEGNIEEGLAQVNRAIELKPGNFKAMLNAGLALLRADRFQEAALFLENALAVNPAYMKAHDNLAIAYASLGKSDLAILHLAESLRLDPNNPVAHFNLGRLLLTQGRRRQAEEHFQRAVKLAPPLASKVEGLLGASPGNVAGESPNPLDFRLP
ncbi:MAG: tetratricopeptide repeat protein, partial [Pseudomonadota bacterium]